MRLRNKRTGEIVDFKITADYDDVTAGWKLEGRGGVLFYDHIDEIKEEWEDVPEEPKEYWFIDAYGNIVQNKITKQYGDEYTDMSDDYERQKQIGNYFESEEEAEKAVEKLKAFRRLEDKGFRFNGYSHYDWNGNESPAISFEYPDFDEMFDNEQVVADLDICFGGEE